jgi:hypothetical protein
VIARTQPITKKKKKYIDCQGVNIHEVVHSGRNDVNLIQHLNRQNAKAREKWHAWKWRDEK